MFLKIKTFSHSDEMGIENITNFLILKTSHWKYEIIFVLILVLVIFYIKHKLSFWSRQLIPYEIILMNSWFSKAINEIDLKNTIKYGKVFGLVINFLIILYANCLI